MVDSFNLLLNFISLLEQAWSNRLYWENPAWSDRLIAQVAHSIRAIKF